ncbi:MAG TPA: ElyC/SanA/YdcF family protein [Patescibacteria group bacterium]|nr:ElyC/SanA/YdcF family protein [Patescibacteria group bacterium]
MDFERRIPRRAVIEAGLGASEALLAVGLTIAGSAVIHPNNTERVLGKIVDNREIECSHDIEPTNKDGYPYDALAIPSAGRQRIGNTHDFEPNPNGKIRLMAAAIAFMEGVAPKIILLDGEDKTGEFHETNKTYLIQQLRRLGWQGKLPADDPTLTEYHSINTATNMSELAKLVRQNKMSKVKVITSGGHINRSMQLACANGIHARSESAENIVLASYPNSQEIKDLVKSVQETDNSLKENAELGWSIVDPKGTGPTIVRRILNSYDRATKPKR